MQQKLLLFALVVAFFVFVIDFGESFFENTRKVHAIHNFPDLLGKAYPTNPTFSTHLEAGFSAIKCLFVPLLVGSALFFWVGTETKLRLCTLLASIGFAGILVYLVWVGGMEVEIKDPFLVHKFMYAVGLGCFAVLLCPQST